MVINSVKQFSFFLSLSQCILSSGFLLLTVAFGNLHGNVHWNLSCISLEHVIFMPIPVISGILHREFQNLFWINYLRSGSGFLHSETHLQFILKVWRYISVRTEIILILFFSFLIVFAKSILCNFCLLFFSYAEWNGIITILPVLSQKKGFLVLTTCTN